MLTAFAVMPFCGLVPISAAGQGHPTNEKKSPSSLIQALHQECDVPSCQLQCQPNQHALIH